ncbi:MAG TPA: dienelactone hydrolase family protein [Caulobacteraceae bacterium]|nr:dienelactone hydrolase family protein [Caulobacteraceae bacterium]
MADRDALAAYERFEFTDGPWTREVFRRGEGPAVIVIHEMPGLHPLVIRFADRVAAAGMTVFLPSLFGQPGKPVSVPYALGTMSAAICIRREFHVWAGAGSSPIVAWLRALARKAHAECGGKGVGAVGMCFTGGFALAMMTEPAVVAPVLSQPSQPILGRGKDAAVDATPAEIACAKRRLDAEDLSVIGLRFKGDGFVPEERFETLKRELGDRFEAIELEAVDALAGTGLAPHSVLTIHLDDREGTPTKAAEQRVISFFKQRTGA